MFVWLFLEKIEHWGLQNFVFVTSDVQSGVVTSKEKKDKCKKLVIKWFN